MAMDVVEVEVGLSTLKDSFISTFYKPGLTNAQKPYTKNMQWTTYLLLARKQKVGRISHKSYFEASKYKWFENIGNKNE